MTTKYQDYCRNCGEPIKFVRTSIDDFWSHDTGWSHVVPCEGYTIMDDGHCAAPVLTLAREVYALAHQCDPDHMAPDDAGLPEITALLDAKIAEWEANRMWWVETAQIRADQYRALSQLVHSQQEAIQRLTILTPAVIETYVNRFAPSTHSKDQK